MATSPERLKEAEDASVLFHIAMAQIGAQAVGDALALWDDVPPLPAKSGARAIERWLGTAVRYVMERRLRARDLAWAYYRYQRALTTGTTIAMPGIENPPYMTLPELKREFEFFLSEDTPEAEADAAPVRREVPGWARSAQAVSRPRTDDPVAADEVSEDDEEDDELDRILLEEIEGLDAELDEAERLVEEEIERALQALGPANMDSKMASIEVTEDDPPEELDTQREQAHTEAGNRQAATAAREVMNGARGTVYAIGDRDPKVIGFIRASRTGTPCGWCAMLISRGFVPKSPSSSMYRSAQGTGVQADGSIVTYGDLDLYHDNCQCYAIPVFDRASLAGDQFAINRKYAELWPIVTKGLGGKAALTAWRRFIRQEAKSQKSQEAAA